MKKITAIFCFATISTIAFFACSKGNTTTKPANNSFPVTATVPTLSTAPPSNIGFVNATCGGTIISDGGSPILISGVEYSTDRSAIEGVGTVVPLRTMDGPSSGSYVSNVYAGGRGVKIYVRAYARNARGYGYGNMDSFTTKRGVFVRDIFGGGIVFYVDSTFEHGLTVSLSEQSAGSKWNNGPFINIAGAKNKALGTGLANTNAIIAAQGPGNYAASICRNYAGGGFHDWYLPSLEELKKMYFIATRYSDRPYYWSSTQDISEYAWCMYYNDLVGYYTDTYHTDILMHVRAIRSF